MFGIGIYHDAETLEPFEPANKQVEIKDTMLTGYKDGQVSWQVSADYLWAGRSRYLYRAEHIRSGRIYNKNKDVILKDIQANEIKVNSKTRIFSAEGGVTATFVRRITDSGKEEDIEEIFIEADSLSYYESSNRAVIRDNIVMKRDGLEIVPSGDVAVDLDYDKLTIKDGFRLEDDDVIISGDELGINISSNEGEVKGNLSAYRKPKNYSGYPLDEREIELRQFPTEMTADMLSMTEIDGQREIVLQGDVVISQNGKLLHSQKAMFSEVNELYVLEGDVDVSFSSLEWLVNPDKKLEFKNQDTKESIFNPTHIKADKLQFDALSFEVKMIGDVRISQPDKTITSRKLVYDDREGHLLLFGAVQINREDKDTIKAEKIDIDVYEETVVADGEVTSEFEITR